MKRRNIITVVVFILLAVLIVGVYYYFLTHPSKEKEDVTSKKTVVQQLIDKDLDYYYPATTNTVLETYCRYTQALFNEEYTDEQYTSLLSQYRKLMDDELLANNPLETQTSAMKEEIEKYKDDNKNFFNYRFVEDPSNKESIIDGKICASVTMSFSVKIDGSKVEITEQIFILRKDSEGKWKILGWKPKENPLDTGNAAGPSIGSALN